MKKIIILIAALIITNIFSYAGNPIIKKVPPTKDIKGGDYFPLFMGEKWTWEISVNEVKSTMSWEIISYSLINDLSNDLKNVYGFEATAGSELPNWFFIEYDGFICSYGQSDSAYLITRLFPANPQLGDKWSVSGDNYSVTEINEQRVKVEYENEEEGRFGYQVFKKGVGFDELFESSKKGDGKNILKYKLLNHIDISKVDFSKYAFEEKKEDTRSLENTEKKDNKEEEVKIDKNTDYNISSLSKELSYIQIASFNSSTNANNYSLKIVALGYSPKIFKDKDGYYKVLVDATSDEKVFLEKIKKDVEKNAFIKQRKK
ncbi:MAG TPA: SPOR domain-containing protein [Spirochaetota bacterium]|nr:SPOR domain-containing protein [Spirochaetota bacterium]